MGVWTLDVEFQREQGMTGEIVHRLFGGGKQTIQEQTRPPDPHAIPTNYRLCFFPFLNNPPSELDQ